jgi:hypothetical protein
LTPTNTATKTVTPTITPTLTPTPTIAGFTTLNPNVSTNNIRGGYMNGSQAIFIGGGNGLITSNSDASFSGAWTVNNTGFTGSQGFGMTFMSNVSLFIQAMTSDIVSASSLAGTWTSRATFSGWDVVYSSSLGTAVAVGNSGVISSSTNGTSWTSRTSNTSQNLRGVAWSSTLGLFVAAGGSSAGSGTIVSSPDGTNWTVRVSTAAQIFVRVRWLNGAFYAVGDAGQVYVSTNGTSWGTQYTIGSGFNITDITYGSSRGIYMVVGGGGGVWTSGTGASGSWTQLPAPTAQNFWCVLSNGNYFVLGGNSGVAFSRAV